MQCFIASLCPCMFVFVCVCTCMCTGLFHPLPYFGVNTHAPLTVVLSRSQTPSYQSQCLWCLYTLKIEECPPKKKSCIKPCFCMLSCWSCHTQTTMAYFFRAILHYYDGRMVASTCTRRVLQSLHSEVQLQHLLSMSSDSLGWARDAGPQFCASPSSHFCGNVNSTILQTPDLTPLVKFLDPPWWVVQPQTLTVGPGPKIFWATTATGDISLSAHLEMGNGHPKCSTGVCVCVHIGTKLHMWRWAFVRFFLFAAHTACTVHNTGCRFSLTRSGWKIRMWTSNQAVCYHWCFKVNTEWSLPCRL